MDFEIKKYKSTAEVHVPEKLIDQVIGQDNAVKIIKKAAKQRRNVLLVGKPGTGKSMLAKAMAGIMPVDKLYDVLSYPNPLDSNEPVIQVASSGEAKKMVQRIRLEEKSTRDSFKLISFLIPLGWFILTFVFWELGFISDIIFAATLLVGAFIVIGLALSSQMKLRSGIKIPKILIDNSDKKTAPFVDATGARAGALFGDVKHDPLQTIFPHTVVYIENKKRLEPVILQTLVDRLLKKYPDLIETNGTGYEGLVLPKDEKIYVLGYIKGRIKPVRILCVNRKKYDGKMYAVRSKFGRVLITPEHKVYVKGKYIEANKLNGKEPKVTISPSILTKEDIINTFSKQDQISSQKYFEFLKLKKKDPKLGYKKIAQLLKIKPGQTRWWNNNTNKPKPVRTIERLKLLGLLPLKLTDDRLAPISRVLGSTFGNGGIFSNLNAIFLSSAEKQAIIDYKNDLIEIFGKSIVKNFKEQVGGINKSSKCISNTDRDIIRFFVALGAPIGRKGKQKLKVPVWVYMRDEAQKGFFGAFLGNELCSPKFSDKSLRVQGFGVAIGGTERLRNNRIYFLNSIAKYLNSYGVNTVNKIYENNYRDESFVWKLSISKKIGNIVRFSKAIPLYYSKNKEKRIEIAIRETINHKREYIFKLEKEGRSKKYILSTLRISEGIYDKLKQKRGLDFKKNIIEFKGRIYNVTTESGNLFANGILISNSGGLGTPPHLRVMPGMIHKANKGVLFIDEIATLSPNSQQDLLTAMQDKKTSITGQSELSSGAMVRTKPVPCDFVLVAAGNYSALKHVHPALRSRIRGYGYEVHMNEDMPDNEENRSKIVQFVAQEIKADGKIPHFSKDAVDVIIFEARRRASAKKKLTLKLRELGGLIRAAGDLALERGKSIVGPEDVLDAKKLSRTLEEQIVEKYIALTKNYEVFSIKGKNIGKVNGLAVLSDMQTGTIIPIEAEISPAQSKTEGRIIATGKLGDIAKEAVLNISALIKRISKIDLSNYDIHVQFLQTYSGVEGDSASVSVTTAVISAIFGIPIDQSLAMTGSLSVKGEVLPIGGATAKVSAAIKAGFKKVILPWSNVGDVVLLKEDIKKIKIVPVHNLYDVLSVALIDGRTKDSLLKNLNVELKLSNDKTTGKKATKKVAKKRSNKK